MRVGVAVREDEPMIEIGYGALAAIAGEGCLTFSGSVHCFTYFAGGIHW